MIRLLVAGAGLIGRRHVAAIEAVPEVELAGVIDPVLAAREGWSAPGFPSIAAVDIDADGIVIATPNALHEAHAQEAGQRHWPMLIEKPIAATLAEADRVVQLAESAGLPILVGHHRRHHGIVRELKKLLDAGAIGQPLSATALWHVRKPDDYFSVPWRSGLGGSPVAINLVHDIDLMRYLFGEIDAIAGLAGKGLRGSTRPETGVIVLRMQSGLVASVSFSDNAPSPWGFEAGTGENPNIATTGQDCLWVTGTTGAISFPSLTLWQGASDWAVAPEAEAIPSRAGVPLERQIRHFCAVIEGTENPVTDARDARATLAATLDVERLLASDRDATSSRRKTESHAASA